MGGARPASDAGLPRPPLSEGGQTGTQTASCGLRRAGPASRLRWCPQAWHVRCVTDEDVLNEYSSVVSFRAPGLLPDLFPSPQGGRRAGAERAAGARAIPTHAVFTAVSLHVQTHEATGDLLQHCFLQRGRPRINKVSSGPRRAGSDRWFTFRRQRLCGVSDNWFDDRQLVYSPHDRLPVSQVLSHRCLFAPWKISTRSAGPVP